MAQASVKDSVKAKGASKFDPAAVPPPPPPPPAPAPAAATAAALLTTAVTSVKGALATTLGSAKDASSSSGGDMTSERSVGAPVVSDTFESRHWVEVRAPQLQLQLPPVSIANATSRQPQKRHDLTNNPLSAPSPLPPVDMSQVKKYLPTRQIESILPFKDFFAIFGREGGLERVWIATRDASEWRAIPFAESCHSVWCGANFVYSAGVLRLGYSSLVTPKQVIEYDVASGQVGWRLY